jgi:hypothetical protein
LCDANLAKNTVMRNASFKAKASLTGLALTVLAGATLQGGEAHAALTCTFGNLAGCNGSLGNVTFSGFAVGVSSTGYEAGDVISISKVGNVYKISGIYGNPMDGDYNTLVGTGNFSFNAVADTGYNFTNADVVSYTAGAPVAFYNTITGFPFSPLASLDGSSASDSVSGIPSTSVIVAWAISGTGSASSSLLDLTLAPPAGAPAPLPLFGAAAAFSFSRRLRQRQKALV